MNFEEFDSFSSSNGGEEEEEGVIKERGKEKEGGKEEGEEESSSIGKEKTCYFCTKRVNRENAIYPCKCVFSPAHLECVFKWTQEGHPKCRICNQMYNIPLPRPLSSSSSSSPESSERRPPEQWIPTIYTIEQERVLMEQERTVRRGEQYVEWLENTLKVILCAIYAFICILFIAPTDFVSLFGKTVFNSFTIPKDVPRSFLLFPGHAQQFILFDTWYIALLLLFPMFSFVNLIRFRSKLVQLFREMPPSLKYVHVPAIGLVSIVLSHFFGNLHYCIFCAAKVIPAENCFYMLNFYSFAAGPAGFLYLATIVLLSYGVFFLVKCLACKQ